MDILAVGTCTQADCGSCFMVHGAARHGVEDGTKVGLFMILMQAEQNGKLVRAGAVELTSEMMHLEWA